MSAPLKISAELYWRWRAAEAERRAVLLDNARRLQAAEDVFQAACEAIAEDVPAFDPNGKYRIDDANCTVTAVAE